MTFAPPPGPPPLLSEEQLLYLAGQGHLPLPVPDDLRQAYTKLFRTVDSDLFSLPDDEKFSLYPVHETEEVGYRNVTGEKQFVTLRHHTHPDSELETLVHYVWHETAALLHRVLYDLASVLGSIDPVTLWRPILDNTADVPTAFDETDTTFLRLFQYLPLTGTSDQHTDLGLLTLCVTRGQGLQVMTFDDNQWGWQDGAEYTLLIGSALRAFLQDKVRAGFHRVVGNPQGRSSAIFALRPNLKHQVDMSLFGGEGVMEMNTYWRKVLSSRYNVNAPEHERHQQRKRFEKRTSTKTDPSTIA